MLPVEQPFKTYTGLDGKPLDNGYVYFGQPNQNPITAPVTVFWDAAGMIPAAQPLRTAGGYIMRAGTPASVFFDGTYSQLVLDSKKRRVSFASTSSDFSVASAVSGFIGSVGGNSGAAQVGVLLPGYGSLKRTVAAELQESVKVTRWMSDEQVMDAFLRTWQLDCSAAIQAATDYCCANHVDLEFPYLFKTNSPIKIDRQVDGATYDCYFTMFSKTGGGIYVDTSIPIFSSRLEFSGSPVSQLARWHNMQFVASNNGLDAYVLDGARFLRSVFDACSFSKIKCLNASTYVQSISLNHCNARRWAGTFFKAGPQGYDIQVIGGLYEAGSGDCFDIASPIGCKFITQIEGMSGTALKLAGCQGVDISLYAEANGLDFDCRTGNLPNYGINLHGSYFSHPNATFSVMWGECYGCTSHGNWHTNNMHDLQSNSYVEINDAAQGTLANSGDVVSHMGYRQGDTPKLNLRGSNSDSYTTTGEISKYTRCGNRIDIEFVGTMASTGANPQDTLYIPSLLPFDSAYPGMLCGTVEVTGSAVNSGISPMYITLAVPLHVQSSIPVIPANNAGDTWTVRGHLSYQSAT